MGKKTMLLFFVLICFFAGIVFPSSTITLKYGTNEVSIKIMNNAAVNIENLSLTVNNDDFPEGITASLGSGSIDLPSKSKSEEGLIIYIEVDKHAEPGVYQIPIRLKDNKNHSWNFTITAQIKNSIPDDYDLSQNYPNPCNPFTQIQYALANERPQDTRLVIFNIMGREIRTLVNKRQSGGNYHVTWDGRDDDGNLVSSGIYYYRITSGSFSQMKKITMIK